MSAHARLRVVAILVVACGQMAVSACGDSSGPSHTPQPMDFFAAFPTNSDLTQNATLSLLITGRAGVAGTVTIASLGVAANFLTDTTGFASVTLPGTAMLNAWDTVLPLGVIIHADDSVGVVAVNDKPSSMQTAALLPGTALGLHHFALTSRFGDVLGSFVALVGTLNGTTVTLTPSATAGSHAAQTSFQVVLNRGDAYQLEATDSTGDLSSTVVQSDKPIAVFSGHLEGQVPGGTCCAGMLWTAIPPTAAVTGTEFLTVPFSSRTETRVRVMGLQDGTTLASTGIIGLATSLQAGQVSEGVATAAASLTSNQPILVGLLAESQYADNAPGSDPCLTLLSPVGGYQSEYRIATPVDQVDTAYVNIIASSGAVGSIKMNGTAVGAGSFTAIGASGYSGATVGLGAGINDLTGNGAAFGAVVYGSDTAGAANTFCFTPGVRF